VTAWQLKEANRHEAARLAGEGWEPFAVTTGPGQFGSMITFHLRRPAPPTQKHVPRPWPCPACAPPIREKP
jgi:hypothetical protein